MRRQMSDLLMAFALTVCLAGAAPALAQNEGASEGEADAGRGGPAAVVPTEAERMVLSTVEDIVQVFRHDADGIWPGYDLSDQPFVVYIPDEWALLVNCPESVTGFGRCPENWPSVGAATCCLSNDLGNLVGQLVFDYDAGGVSTVAVGFPDPLPEMEYLRTSMLGYVTHEAFHQYQSTAFGETEWAREQKYPVDDVENSALAYLEMLLLRDAVDAAWSGDEVKARSLIGEFVAVRTERWGRGDGFVPTYERGKEATEGTARYVEMNVLDRFSRLHAGSVRNDASVSEAELEAMLLPGRLLRDFDDRMGDGFVPTSDLPRNRIYPVAAAQGFLLDFLGAEWKPLAELNTADFTFVGLMRETLGLAESDLAGLAAGAKDRNGFSTLLSAAELAAERHMAEYDELLARFRSQDGIAVELVMDANGLRRSRSSSARRIVVDRGARELCERYDVYTLEGAKMFFEIHDDPLLELNDYDRRTKTVIFYAPGDYTLSADGKELNGVTNGDVAFASLEFGGEGFELTHAGPGALVVKADRIVIDLAGN